MAHLDRQEVFYHRLPDTPVIDGFSDLKDSASYLHAPAELRDEIRQIPSFFQDHDQIQAIISTVNEIASNR